jgi:hypothetical protein
MMVALLSAAASRAVFAEPRVQVFYAVDRPSVARGLPTGIDTVDGYQVDAGVRKSTTRVIRKVGKMGSDWLIGITHTTADGRETTSITRTNKVYRMVEQLVQSKADSGQATWYGDSITGWISPKGKPKTDIDVTPSHPLFPDDGISPWILGVLPLADGMTGTIGVYNMWVGGERYESFRVSGSDRVAFSGAKVDCWTVELDRKGPPGYSETRWIDKATGRQVLSHMHKGKGDTEYWSALRGVEIPGDAK